MSTRIITGDALTELRKLPDASVHCCVTSPPYWGLRCYGVDGQYGLEPTIGEYIEKMVAVFAEVRRVLRDDGTAWVNMGDSYASNAGGYSDTGSRGTTSCPSIGAGTMAAVLKGRGRMPPDGLKPKDLCGIPWRLAFALQADGWWLRQDIIWAKPNPMPESVTDRCTKAHEYIFLLAKSERYCFDAPAISEPLVSDGRGGFYQNESAYRIETQNGGASSGERQREWGRNKRSVWTVATAPFKDAHFATFPPALIEPCILAGCPIGGTVLDPFGGAGTTALVADRLQRNAILIELNPQYASMARDRVHNDAPLFAETAA